MTCELAVGEALIGFKRQFFLEQYVPRKSTKWRNKTLGIADGTNYY
jgi:hypothetical protein